MHKTIFKEEPCNKCEHVAPVAEMVGKYACLCDNVPTETPTLLPDHLR